MGHDDGPVDLRAVTVPAGDVPLTDYTARQRRADLLARIEEAGHPRLLPTYRDLGDQYGVDGSTISRDMDRVAESVDAHTGERTTLTVDAVYRRSVRGLMEEEKWRQAAKTASEWSEWVDRRTVLATLSDRLDALADGLDGDAEVGDWEAETYPELVTSEGDEAELVAVSGSGDASVSDQKPQECAAVAGSTDTNADDDGGADPAAGSQDGHGGRAEGGE